VNFGFGPLPDFARQWILYFFGEISDRPQDARDGYNAAPYPLWKAEFAKHGADSAGHIDRKRARKPWLGPGVNGLPRRQAAAAKTRVFRDS
jgi:hypothetical protein